MDNPEQLIELTANSISYESYFELFKQKSEITDVTSFSADEAEKLSNVKINFQRSSRIHRTYQPNEFLKEAVQNIKERQFWFLITESWCGDSAQNIPYIVEIAKLNPLIEIKIVLRDQNLDFMDLYLTNGNRSIPKLIAFDENQNELFQWGPRPKEAHELVMRLKEEGKAKTEFLEQLHLWYGRNRGKVLESEMIELLNSL